MASLWDEWDSLGGEPSSNEAYWRNKLSNQGSISATPPRSLWKRFIDSTIETMREGPAALAAGVVAPLVPTGEGANYTERRSRLIAKEKERRANVAAVDPAHGAAAHVADFAGGIAGSLASDPTNLINPGGGLVKQIVGNAAIGAGADALQQGGDIALGLADDFSPFRSIINAVAGPALIAGVHGGKKVAGKVSLGYQINNGVRMPGWRAINDIIVNDLEGGGTLAKPKVSPKGAMGPQQVMPETARKPGFGIKPWDGKTQADLARVGRQYSAAMMHKYNGDPAKVFAAYNAGPGRVDSLIKKHGDDWYHHLPAETMKYVKNGLSELGVGGRVDAMNKVNVPNPGGHQAVNDTAIGDREGAFREMPFEDFNSPEIQDILRQADDTNADVLTPAERQEMDASVPRAPENSGALSDDILDSVIGKGTAATTPVNDTRVGRFDEYTDGPLDKEDLYSTVIENEIKARAVSDALAKRGPFENRQDFEAAMREESEKYETENTATIHPIKRLLKDIADDESGSFNPRGIFGANRGSASGSTQRAATKANRKRIKSADPKTLDTEERIIHDLYKLNPKNKEQAAIYEQEHARRGGHLKSIQAEGGGLENLNKQLGALKGEMPRAEFDSIAKNYSTQDITDLFNRINFSNTMLPYEKTNAQIALRDLLANPDGTKLPTPYEMGLLARVFSEDFIKALRDKRDWKDKAWDNMINAVNVPRALMSSTDLSAPFRQGIGFVGKAAFWKNMGPMFKALASEDYSKEIMNTIRSDPRWEGAKKAGLSIVDPHSHHLTDREEGFQSDMAEHIPGLGHVVKASNRAYSGFLNKLRWDVYTDMLKKYEAAGLTPNQEKLGQIANFVNSFSGRGTLGSGKVGKTLNAASPLLSGVLFSPKLIVSRAKMLASPVTYLNADPILRKEAWKSILSYSAYVAANLYIAKEFLGADVETDLRSADFAKAKFGNTRRDSTGGLGSYVRFVAELATQSKITQKGEEAKIYGGRNGPAPSKYDETMMDVIKRFGRSKEEPITSLLHNILAGENILGEPVGRMSKVGVGDHKINVPSEILERFIPMTLNDLYEVDQDADFMKAIGFAPGAIFGESIQTYAPKEDKKKDESPFSSNVWDEWKGMDSSSSGGDLKSEWDKLGK